VTTILERKTADRRIIQTSKEWLVAPEDGEWRLVWFDDRDDLTAAAEGFFGQVNAADGTSTLDGSITEFAHSASPLVNVANYTPWVFRGLQRQELLGAEVVAEDITKGEIATEFPRVVSWASPSELDTIAADNAVVAVRLRDERAGIEAFTQRWLLAPELDEWRVVGL
jgi:hypothetical protein